MPQLRRGAVYIAGGSEGTTLRCPWQHSKAEFHLQDCTSLTQLPEAVLQWGPSFFGRPHEINITGSGISEATMQTIRQAAGPNVRIIFGANERADRTRTEFADVGSALAFWQGLATRGTQTPGTAEDSASPAVPGTPDQLHNLLQFLGRLQGTADYRNPQSRTALAARILQLVASMGGSEAVTQVCHERIGEALESCGDRVIWALNQVEVSVHVHAALQDAMPEEALRALGRSLLRLQVVQQHAAAKVASLRIVDPIEVYLAYETGLAQLAQLPVSTQNMLYARLSDVTGADLESAREAAWAADADPRQVAEFLQSWAPWQQHQRRQAAAACVWEKVPVLPSEVQLSDDDICLITQQTLAEMRADDSAKVVAVPVAGKPGAWQIYDHAALLAWWQQEGTDAQRQPLLLQALRRVP